MSLLTTIKNQKFIFYSSSILRGLIPKFIYNYWRKKSLKSNLLNDPEFQKRLHYYISKDINTKPQENWVQLKDFKLPKRGSLYYFDLLRYTRYFPLSKKINYKFGDVTENFDSPTIVKSRPIQHNGNSVIMKVDSLRHFNFVNDKIAFKDKKDLLVWRGEIHKENRRLLLDLFHDHPLCNIGEVTRKKDHVKEWQKGFLTVKEQLQYKFVISIEGNDVATNLKWILSSNSLCFMPKPKFETWFMEGLLIPDFHYVIIKDDYSDLLEKREYYLNNEAEALQIIANANQWVKQFKNRKTEKLLSISVLNNFFKQTGQE